jgi:hypothetical protein
MKARKWHLAAVLGLLLGLLAGSSALSQPMPRTYMQSAVSGGLDWDDEQMEVLPFWSSGIRGARRRLREVHR